MPGPQSSQRSRARRHGGARRIPELNLSPEKLIPTAMVFLALGAAIVWRTLPAALSFVRPDLSIDLRLDQPAAIINRANEEIAVAMAERAKQTPAVVNPDPGSTSKKQSSTTPTRETGSDLEALRQSLFSAVRENPLDSTGFRLLGNVALLLEREREAEIYMKIAGDMSVHETPALYWLMEKAIADGRDQDVMTYADVILLTQPGAIGYVGPALLKMAETARGKKSLVAKLTKSPGWRSAFLQSFSSGNFSRPTLPLEILLDVKDAGQNVSLDDLQGYLRFLVSRRLYNLAYSTWLRFLPEKQLRSLGFVYNGGYEEALSGLPFDWIIGKGESAHVSVQSSTRKDEAHVLNVRFSSARIKFPSVRQMILLNPGAYTLTGNFSGTIVARRGLAWTISCVSGLQLGQGEGLLSSGDKWREFKVDFTVPKENCEAQYLSLSHLARYSSEQFASGQMWFDNLQIERRTK